MSFHSQVYTSSDIVGLSAACSCKHDRNLNTDIQCISSLVQHVSANAGSINSNPLPSPTYPMPEKVLIVNIILGVQSLEDAISSEDKIIAKSKLNYCSDLHIQLGLKSVLTDRHQCFSCHL